MTSELHTYLDQNQTKTVVLDTWSQVLATSFMCCFNDARLFLGRLHDQGAAQQNDFKA